MLAQDAGTHYIHLCHPGWDHHVQIWDRTAKSNHYTLCAELDPALSSLMEDLSTTASKSDPAKTLLDETLVVVMSEFGRTPGALNNMAGRDHYNRCYPALFAGGGVKPGRILFEMEGVPETEARQAMRLASHKLPVATRVVLRESAKEAN